MTRLLLEDIKDEHIRRNFEIIEKQYQKPESIVQAQVSFSGAYRVAHLFEGRPETVLFSSSYPVTYDLNNVDETHIYFTLSSVSGNITITFFCTNVVKNLMQAEQV